MQTNATSAFFPSLERVRRSPIPAAERVLISAQTTSNQEVPILSLIPETMPGSAPGSTMVESSSIRFGLGRFNTQAEVDYVAAKVIDIVKKLRELSPLYEMVKEGIDLTKIQWAAH